jgi:hypothetical protein
MAEYINKATDGAFLDLIEDKDFQKDLVQFFTGGRYNYTEEDYRKKGVKGLANDFVEHMRVHEWNEVTAAKDLNYALNKDVDIRGKQAFGRLIQAWDRSDRAGSNNFFTSAGDYLEAIGTAPSTYLGLGTFGVAKLGSKAASKGVQMYTRKKLQEQLAKKYVPGLATTTTIGAVEGVVVGGGQAALQGETREELIEGYEYTVGDMAFDASVNAALGGVLGNVSGRLGRNKQANVDELFLKSAKASEKLRTTSVKKATDRLKNPKNATDADRIMDAAKRVVDVEAVLAAKAGDRTAKILDPLDPEKVKRGSDILNIITNPNAKGEFQSGISIDTLRSVTAATLDIIEELKVGSDERITSAVSNAIRDGNPEILSKLDDIRNNYGLSREEMSLVYLSEFSKAGKTLAEASIIKRAQTKAMKEAFNESAEELKGLAKHGVSTFSDQMAAELSQQVIRNSAQRTKLGKTIDFLRDTDGMRIAFMTSQMATTVRNVTSTGILAGVDIMDEFNRGLITGQIVKNPGDVLLKMTSTLRGMTWNQAQARALKDIFKAEMPETYTTVFNDAMRLEVGVQSQSYFAKAGRAVNVFNTATDTFFKESMFFASLERQLADQGMTVKQFIESGASLDSLPDNAVRKAYDDANRFTMQRDYIDDDSAFGQAARFAVKLNRKVPYLVSGALGVPFPRYVANHLEMIADYTPILNQLARKVGSDPVKTGQDRTVRNMTGISMITLGIAAAAMKDGEVDYKSIETSLGAEADIAPNVGFVIAHFYLGDMIYRLASGKPLPKARELGTVLGGVSDFSADFTLVEELAKSVIASIKGGRPEFTEGFQKSIGNVAATFTYPGIIGKDVLGQINYDKAGTPFIRNVEGESVGADSEDVSLYGEKSTLQTIVGQATRFLMDSEAIQYTQSFNGKTDINYYSPFNPQPIGKINPLLKQISGVAQNAPMTEIEREMNRLAIDPYDFYKTYGEKNASIDYQLRYELSQTLPQQYEYWVENTKLGKLGKGRTYSELDDIDLKAKFLKEFVDQKIKEGKAVVQGRIDDLKGSDSTKHMVRGYIRNNYAIKREEIGAAIFDEAATQLSKGSSKTSKEFLAKSEDVLDELNRRQALLHLVDSINAAPGQ